MEIIVVLGCSLTSEGLSAENIGRLDRALALYNFKKTINPQNKILFIVSGDGSKNGLTEAEAMFTYLSSNDIPKSQILLEPFSTNTISNIINTTSMMIQMIKDGYEIEFITYVSSSYHLTRVSRIVNVFGVTGVPYNTLGSEVFFPSRIIAEREIMKDLDRSIEYYRTVLLKLSKQFEK